MPGEFTRLKSLLRAVALYMEARGRLLQIEAQEAGGKLSTVLVVSVLLAGSLLCGWLLALPALVWLVAESQGWHWSRVALGAAGLHFFLGLVLLAFLKARLRRLKIFEETFHQFQRDRECLSGNPNLD